MDDLDLLVDLHLDAPRQGPGSDDMTRRAIELSGLRGRAGSRIADVGCGSGASTLVLAGELDATIVAVDLLPPFLRALEAAAERAGLGERIETVASSMDSLPFEDGSLDAIWSEGAIYHLGFTTGVRTWRRFLKPDGILAVTELTWLTGSRPAELEAHWTAEYAEVDTASAKLAALEANGYAPLGYFPLPRRCWIEHYYRPMQARIDAFLERNDHSAAARAVVEAELQEIDLYERFSDFVGYGFYVAKRTQD